MKNLLKIIILIVLLNPLEIYSREFFYIFNDKCISDLYEKANVYFKNSEVKVLKDSRGIILRKTFLLENIFKIDVESELVLIENFLANIENSAIIEVHTGKNADLNALGLKNWEFSTIIANRIEAIITKPEGSVKQDKINSVGYGEFLPVKNTPNNGGNNQGRVDIIVLCNISGE